MPKYRITIKGRLTDRFAPAFPGMGLVPGPGHTCLVGLIEDQAHLFGLLDRVRSLGLELISVQPTSDERRPDGAAGESPDATGERRVP